LRKEDEVVTKLNVKRSRVSVSIEAVTAIDASPAAAWAVLADTAAYPEWNPLVRRLDGAIVVGRRVDVDLSLKGRRFRMHPRIVRLEGGRAFTWLGRVGLPGLFDGLHRFEIRRISDDTCELVQSETLSGVLVPFVRGLLTTTTPAGFVAMNDAFKSRVERAS
jgi:hypothetical protein